MKDLKILLKKKNTKRENMVMKDIKISQEMKNKNWLSIKRYCEMRKSKSLRNYKKFGKPNYLFFETDLVG